VRRVGLVAALCGAMLALSGAPAGAAEPGCVIGANGLCVSVDPALAIQPVSISLGRLCILPGSCPGP
jgi:hypothetical protein